MKRALVLLVLMGCAGPAKFVDQIDEGRAVLIDENGAAEIVAAAQLPPDAGEGRWIGQPPPEIQAVAALRTRLSRDDDGRDLVLGRERSP